MEILEFIRSSLAGWIDHLVLAVSPVDALWILGALLFIRVSSYAGMWIYALIALAGMWIYALIALPGTLAHELSHFVVALVLGARPSFPSLIPIRTKHSWRLGSVTFRAGYLRALPIALAPLVLAPLALWWAASFLGSASWPLYGLHVWVVAALLSASLPSSVDIKIALPAFCVLAVIAWILWMIR